MDLTAEANEEDFYNPILDDQQVQKQGRADATQGDEDPIRDDYDEMLDVEAFYGDMLYPQNPIIPGDDVENEP